MPSHAQPDINSIPQLPAASAPEEFPDEAAPTAPSPAPLLPGGAPEAPSPEPAMPEFFGGNGMLSPEPNLDGGEDFNFEKTEGELEEESRTEAFDAALQGILPLRPDEIRTLLEHFDRTQESVELPIYPSPKPEVTVETVSLDPGAAPVVVKTAYGHVTTLNVLDMTGSPWPIQDISWAGNFEVIEASSSQGSHIVRISPQSEFATGNMSIRLLTLKTPVIVSLETSRDIVHYRFDAIIPEYGPMAEAPLIDQGITTVAGDVDIASVLQGVPPKGAKKLDVAGVDGRTTAYAFKGGTYVRTPLTLLSPAWSASVASADGMRVYTIKEAPVLLLSDKGKMVRARLSQSEDVIGDMIHGR
ncbi:MAG: DotH/IcmK family type IV secretion protein [Alphaproteobacteria bacterium]